MSLAELPAAQRRLPSTSISNGDDEGRSNFKSQTDLAADDRLWAATFQFKQRRPELSAGCSVWKWQIGAIVLAATALCLAGLLAPELTGFAVLAPLSLSFFALAILRIYSLWLGWSGHLAGPRHDAGHVPANPYPAYSVLVPLFKEAAIARDLVTALRALDYPRSQLQILLVLEQADVATLKALKSAELPSAFEIVVVPAGSPQTKPRALNYALHEARGEFVTVYDAEDVPEPDQLLKAVAAFRAGPANLACLQAKLNVYNDRQSFLTRQFTIEYSVLFDWLLPALQKLRLPVPLGGTSNHFRGLR